MSKKESAKPKKPARGKIAKGRPPVFDYDDDALYDEIYHLAFNGASDAEIVELLENDKHERISIEVFNAWKNGRYDKWTPEDNERRSKRLVGVLTRARSKVVFALKNTFFKVALGKVKTKNKGTVKRHLVIDGKHTEDEVVQTTENEIEYAPSLQAIQTLLYHYDPEWRKVQKGIEEDEDGVPRNIEHGISVDLWIKKELADGGDSD
mgnify:CR=1 FL=1